jgi:hypothetical protein
MISLGYLKTEKTTANRKKIRKANEGLSNEFDAWLNLLN